MCRLGRGFTNCRRDHSAGGTICACRRFPGPCEVDFNSLVGKEKTIITSLAYSDEFPTVIAMLNDGRLQAEPLITRTISIADTVEKGLRQYEAVGAENVRTVIQM